MGVWYEGAKEITKLMAQEFKSRRVRKLLVTLALKDGREITEVINRRKLLGFYYVLSNLDNEKEKVFVLKWKSHEEGKTEKCRHGVRSLTAVPAGVKKRLPK